MSLNKYRYINSRNIDGVGVENTRYLALPRIFKTRINFRILFFHIINEISDFNSMECNLGNTTRVLAFFSDKRKPCLLSTTVQILNDPLSKIKQLANYTRP